MSKPKVAFFEFTSCEGCQLTVVDSLETRPELLEAVEIVQFREAMTEKSEDYQIAFIEGSCVRPADAERLRQIRRQAQTVVALGACAHLAGVNAIRNSRELEQVKALVYGPEGQAAGGSRVNARLLEVYPLARPIADIIPVDAVLPGCPIDRDEFARVTQQLLQGRRPELPDYPLCVECKLLEIVCLFHRGRTCLGPVVRAGCNAICPTYGDGCEGCRGLVSDPNLKALQAAFEEAGQTSSDVLARFGLFGTYPIMNMSQSDGHTTG